MNVYKTGISSLSNYARCVSTIGCQYF